VTVTTVPVTEKSTGSPDHDHSVKTVRTLTPVAAARALKVRRETVHRWMASGRLPVVVELNAQGRPVRRVPVEAIEEMVREGVRDPSPATQAAQRDHAITVTGSEPQSPELVERLVLAEATASTLAAQLAGVRAQATALVARLDEEPGGPWWRRRRSRTERQIEAAALVRALAALPEPSALDEDE
jgi:Helix-turn-helix domain